MAKLSFVNETPHLHINMVLKTSCRADLEAIRQMGSSLISSFLASGKGETGFRNELQQLGLQEKQSELYRQGENAKLNYLVTTK